jgi:hypothetical protein
VRYFPEATGFGIGTTTAWRYVEESVGGLKVVGAGTGPRP